MYTHSFLIPLGYSIALSPANLLLSLLHPPLLLPVFYPLLPSSTLWPVFLLINPLLRVYLILYFAPCSNLSPSHLVSSTSSCFLSTPLLQGPLRKPVHGRTRGDFQASAIYWWYLSVPHLLSSVDLHAHYPFFFSLPFMLGYPIILYWLLHHTL